ncbi:MAG: MBL fold metallo-hydrolase, partial [Syntrophales bacterium]|nr:MBL fold metallo-hydrolase [Syntrophales bacterium]
MIETALFEEVTQIRMSREIGGKPVYWVSAYLVDGLLIDTGCSFTAAELAAFLDGRPVRQIVNTHFHEDHIGGNRALQEKFGVEIFAPADSVPLIAREAKLFPYQETVWGYPAPAETRPLPAVIRTERHLFDVIDTPGHSAGHAALVEKSRGWCFSGDIFAREKMKFIRPEEDMGKTVASMRRLMDLPAHRLILFTSVGRIVEDGRRALQDCIQSIEELSRRAKALEKNGRGVPEIVRELFGGEHAF